MNQVWEKHMSTDEYTLEAKYELVPFGECICEITFCYNDATDDETVEIQSARFYDSDFARLRDLGREASANIHRDIDKHLLEFGREQRLLETQGCAEDRAHDDDQSWILDNAGAIQTAKEMVVL